MLAETPCSNDATPWWRCERFDTNQGSAWIMDHCLPEKSLQWIDRFRESLPLDSKRPTVDRRFFADKRVKDYAKSPAFHQIPFPDIERPVAGLLEDILDRHLTINRRNDEVTHQHTAAKNTRVRCHVFLYQRFLEYTKPGSELPPHSDGTKICDDTNLTSTHTLLLYLTDCEEGGETLLLHSACKCQPNAKGPVIEGEASYADTYLIHATQPKRGRILLFPHATPHAGAPVVSLPKICLRAEVNVREDNVVPR